MDAKEISKAYEHYETSNQTVEMLYSVINKIRERMPYHAKLEIDFNGMYRKASQNFYLTESEVLLILEDRAARAISVRAEMKLNLDKLTAQ